ncbi:major facilitator superfamily domain-containing protein 1 [Silurus meridionalis]|nr:major facilitator superfamily domain-containing protein 1 [Silurus meridionalis]
MSSLYSESLWNQVSSAKLSAVSIGGESLAVAQNTYAVNWFKGKELNLVFGLQLSMARVGSTVNMNIMSWVYDQMKGLLGRTGHYTLGTALMIAGATCVLSLVCALLLAYLDKRAERILNKEQGKTGEVIKLKDVKHFPVQLWMIFIICVGYYVAIFPFIGLGQVFFIEKFNFSPPQARAINSIVYIISAPASPLLGFMVDKTGKNVIWVMCAVVTTLLAHMMLAFTFWNPWFAMVLLGVSYSLLACALWPMVAFVVPEHQLGTAYGFMQSIQNLGLALISMAAGAILDSKGYLFLEVFFCACICLALIAVVMLYLVDFVRGGELNLSASERAKLQKSLSAESEVPGRLQILKKQQQQEEHTNFKPLSSFVLRNRYLSRLGAQVLVSYFREASRGDGARLRGETERKRLSLRITQEEGRKCHRFCNHSGGGLGGLKMERNHQQQTEIEENAVLQQEQQLLKEKKAIIIQRAWRTWWERKQGWQEEPKILMNHFELVSQENALPADLPAGALGQNLTLPSFFPIFPVFSLELKELDERFIVKRKGSLSAVEKNPKFMLFEPESPGSKKEKNTLLSHVEPLPSRGLALSPCFLTSDKNEDEGKCSAQGSV